jgi:hypothetical protein
MVPDLDLSGGNGPMADRDTARNEMVRSLLERAAARGGDRGADEQRTVRISVRKPRHTGRKPGKRARRKTSR